MTVLFWPCLFGRLHWALNLKEDFVKSLLIYLTLALIAEHACFCH